ncbi:MAG: hypothetical protein EBR30_21155 [Cytophagia bacterium]|nr:hypothetical protein [Cytophagia bacterium]NBW37476.1 hypothetical protein [Cytophagia bacterium]
MTCQWTVYNNLETIIRLTLTNTTSKTAHNSMFALWPSDRLNFSIFIKPTFGFAGQLAASEAGHIANTNVGGKPLP